MVKMIPYRGQVAGEVRPAYFLQAFGKEVYDMRIFSFGACNFACPYCKRNGQYVDANGCILTSVEYSEIQLSKKVVDVVESGAVVRLSGGDPVMYPDLALSLLRLTKELGGISSVAHNGSSPVFIEKILPYLDFAAIDFKGASGDEFGFRAGLKDRRQGEKMFTNSLLVQEMLSYSNVLVDVRTVVFSTTTLDDMLRMADCIVKSGNIQKKFWTIRNYSVVAGCNWEPMLSGTLLDNVFVIRERFPELRIGVRSKWEHGDFVIIGQLPTTEVVGL